MATSLKGKPHKSNPPYPPLSGGQEKTKAPQPAAGVAFSYPLVGGKKKQTPLSPAERIASLYPPDKGG